jgi:type II secretory pathway component GspD/PulD (secretin)
VRRRLILAGVLLGTVAPVLAPVPARGEKADRDDQKAAPPAGMKARVFQIKYQDVESLVDALKPLASGVTGAMLRSNEDLRTVAARDFPENLAAIEQAIKRLDVPGAVRPDVELRIHVLIASPTAASGPAQYPAELEPVVRQLSATLSYRGYFQVASLSQRIRPDGGANGKGELVLAPPATDQAGSAKFHYSVQNVAVAPAAASGGPL